MDNPWRDEERLRELYVNQRLSQDEIAEKLGCGNSTISNWLDKHGIVLPWQDEARMRELYREKRLSQSEIAEKLDCDVSTVEKWMKRHGISGRDTGKAVSIAMNGGQTHDVLSNEALLRDLYREQKLTCEEIADRIGSTTRTVNHWINRYGFKTNEYSQLSDHDEQRLTDESWLREQYVTEERSIPDIASDLDCSIRTVADYLIRHGIERRDMPDAVPSGGVHPDEYGPNWREQRSKALERDDYQCVVCGMTDGEHTDAYGAGLHVHHIEPRRTFMEDGVLDYERANRLENLITLCATCHKRWEGIPLRPEVKRD